MALAAALSSTFVVGTLQVTSPMHRPPPVRDRFGYLVRPRQNRKNNMYYAEGYKGKGANPRLFALNDNYKGSAALPIPLLR